MGIKGKDFVMVCTSSTAVQQIITMKHDEDKILPLDTHSLLVRLKDRSARPASPWLR